MTDAKSWGNNRENVVVWEESARPCGTQRVYEKPGRQVVGCSSSTDWRAPALSPVLKEHPTTRPARASRTSSQLDFCPFKGRFSRDGSEALRGSGRGRQGRQDHRPQDAREVFKHLRLTMALENPLQPQPAGALR